MTSVVIPLGTGSRHNNMELKYALRGIEKYLSGVRNIVIVGAFPAWMNLDTVTYIPFVEKDHYKHLTRNIHQKIVEACMHQDVSDDFLFMNDDHFLLQSFAADKFPYHHTGKVWRGRGKYLTTMEDTRNLLGADIDNYDTHAPMLINKEKYMLTVGQANWSKWFGWCIKTMYCVQNKIEGTYYPDLKIDEAYLSAWTIGDMVQDRPYFSIGDKAITEGMKDFLSNQYPTPSKYEL